MEEADRNVEFVYDPINRESVLKINKQQQPRGLYTDLQGRDVTYGVVNHMGMRHDARVIYYVIQKAVQAYEDRIKADIAKGYRGKWWNRK